MKNTRGKAVSRVEPRRDGRSWLGRGYSRQSGDTKIRCISLEPAIGRGETVSPLWIRVAYLIFMIDIYSTMSVSCSARSPIQAEPVPDANTSEVCAKVRARKVNLRPSVMGSPCRNYCCPSIRTVGGGFDHALVQSVNGYRGVQLGQKSGPRNGLRETVSANGLATATWTYWPNLQHPTDSSARPYGEVQGSVLCAANRQAQGMATDTSTVSQYHPGRPSSCRSSALMPPLVRKASRSVIRYWRLPPPERARVTALAGASPLCTSLSGLQETRQLSIGFSLLRRACVQAAPYPFSLVGNQSTTLYLD